MFVINFETFSVGIFQWVQKNSKKGLKRTKAIYRVRGDVSNERAVYQRAEEICDLLDAGWEPEKKGETLTSSPP